MNLIYENSLTVLSFFSTKLNLRLVPLVVLIHLSYFLKLTKKVTVSIVWVTLSYIELLLIGRLFFFVKVPFKVVCLMFSSRLEFTVVLLRIKIRGGTWFQIIKIWIVRFGRYMNLFWMHLLRYTLVCEQWLHAISSRLHSSKSLPLPFLLALKLIECCVITLLFLWLGVNFHAILCWNKSCFT